MSKIRKIAYVGLTVIVAAVILTLVLIIRANEATRIEETKQQDLTLRFIQQFGAGVDLVEIIEPQVLTIYVWDRVEMVEGESKSIRHWTLLIDGLFVDLGARELVTEE